MHSTFKTKDLSEASYYMCYHITRDRAKRELKFDQHLYAQTITERFGIDKTAMVPATANRYETSVEEARLENPGEGRNDEDFIPRSSGGNSVDVDDDAARYLE